MLIAEGRDISDRQRVETERDALLVQAQAAREAAQAANRSKDEFVAVVAHELRAPLNSIANWAQLLQTRKFDEATIAKALETISRNTQVQVQLIEDLLDVSRIVRGTLQINLVPVNLVEAIKAALEVVRPMIEAKHIHLHTQFTITPQISGDFNRLQQIAVNLLTNAIKFTPPQGRIDIELEQIDSQVQLCVSDTGKGISPEFLSLIFERYKQGQENTGSKDGLGLGLAIVKHLVELHGGTIVAAKSDGEGQGATFTIRLPVLKAIAQKDDTPVISDTTSLAGIRILVVDDEPDMLSWITFVLEKSGAEVQAATNAADALDRLPQFKPDILVSDIAMPGGNGYELLQQMRSRFEGDILAIALTAYESTTYEEKSMQAGFQPHFTKPVDTEVLVAAIVNLIRGRKQQ